MDHYCYYKVLHKCGITFNHLQVKMHASLLLLRTPLLFILAVVAVDGSGGDNVMSQRYNGHDNELWQPSKQANK